MAKRTKKVEAPIIDAVDIDAVAKVNVITNPSMDYSILAFGSDFVNFKNYIEDDLEVMKKNFIPKLGSIVTDREGNQYRLTDIRRDSIKRGYGDDAKETAVDDYRPYVKTVVLPEGLTTLADSAFYGCDALTDVELPESLTYYSIPSIPYESDTQLQAAVAYLKGMDQ